MLRILLIFIVLLSGCGYKSVDYRNKKVEIYCIKSIKFPRAEATALDVFYRAVSDAIISSGNTVECSGKTTRYIFVQVKSLNISPIGYSPAQRASIYKVTVDLDFIIQNRKNEELLRKNIKEMAQYTGTGLSGDVERRYAVEEIGRLVNIRIFSILTGQ
ncbi:hypothetical protein SAMN06265182_1731 [Persephonella hydrogeniphila]|uniref:Lipopolysaccharide-assembly n=1 Tax=Persephonella hydrogeniphila TaxID=198703 RepID=A0A285NKW7_9AQUI|nr:hypothetical protein [Persephonella hydrogeniphila]SNZ10099.1 hypothetical protein SAMN06265182_1731 [Persephonella hydrogeniphila]